MESPAVPTGFQVFVGQFRCPNYLPKLKKNWNKKHITNHQCSCVYQLLFNISETLSDRNWAWTQNHLVRKQTLSKLAKWLIKWLSTSLTKWLSVRLQTKWFWVRVQLQSLKLQISRLLRERSSLTFRKL